MASRNKSVSVLSSSTAKNFNFLIDLELTTIKGMISKGFDNDMVGGKTLKDFHKIKKLRF